MRKKVFPVLLAIVGCILMAYGAWQVLTVPQNAECIALLTSSSNESSSTGKQLLTALDAVSESLGTQVSAYTVVSGVSMEGSLSRSAEVTVYAIGPGWFDINHRTLTEGRLLGEEELRSKTPVIVADEGLMFALFGENGIHDETISLNGTAVELVGTVAHTQQVGQADTYAVYIPLLAAEKLGLTFQTGILCEQASTLAEALFFQNSCSSSWTSGATMFYLNKEKMGAMLPVRYLAVLMLIVLLVWLFGKIRHLLTSLVRKLKERSTHVYAGKMILPCAGFALLALLLAAVWLGGCYAAVNLAVDPVYTFTEWVPENPASLTSILSVFQSQQSAYANAVSLRTPNAGLVQYESTVIRAGAILFLLGMLWLAMRRKKENKA